MDLADIEQRWVEIGDVLPADTNDDIYWLISRVKALESDVQHWKDNKCPNCERLKRVIRKLREEIKWRKKWSRRPKGPVTI